MVLYYTVLTDDINGVLSLPPGERNPNVTIGEGATDSSDEETNELSAGGAMSLGEWGSAVCPGFS